ncbi:MAG: hypothetical protein ACKVX7_07030 [Planctomycetota bacterium]
MARRSFVCRIATLLVFIILLNAGCRVHSDLDRARVFERQGLLVEARAQLQSELRTRASRETAAHLHSIEEQLAEQHFRSAQTAIARGVVVDAARELARCLELYPQHVSALAQFRRLHDATLEAEACRRAVSLARNASEPPTAEELLRLARRLRATLDSPVPIDTAELRWLLDALWARHENAVLEPLDFLQAAAALAAAERFYDESYELLGAAAEFSYRDRLAELSTVVAARREQTLARALAFECLRRGESQAAFRAFARAYALMPESSDLRSHLFATREACVTDLRRALQQATTREEWSRAARIGDDLRQFGASAGDESLSTARARWVDHLLREARRYELLALPGNAFLSLCEAARWIDDAVSLLVPLERLQAAIRGVPLVAIDRSNAILAEPIELVNFRVAPAIGAEIIVRCHSPQYSESRQASEGQRSSVPRRIGVHNVPNPRFVESVTRATQAREQLATLRSALEHAAPEQLEHLLRRHEMLREEVARSELQLARTEPLENRGFWVRPAERFETEELFAVLEWPVELTICDRPTEARTLRAQVRLRRERVTDDSELAELLSVELPSPATVESRLADECRRQLVELLRELDDKAAEALLGRARRAQERGELAQSIELLVRLLLDPRVVQLDVRREAERLLAGLSEHGATIIQSLRSAAQTVAHAPQ